MKKSLISLALAMTMLTLTVLASCGTETVSYSTDISVADLVSAADTALADSETLTAVPDDYIKGMMNIDVSAFEDYAVKIRASGTNIDEYGIFKAPSDEAVKSVKEIVSGYLDMRLDAWMEEYMPEEKPKLENATIKTMGRYVVYCILSDEAKDTVFTTVDNMLLGK